MGLDPIEEIFDGLPVGGRGGIVIALLDVFRLGGVLLGLGRLRAGLQHDQRGTHQVLLVEAGLEEIEFLTRTVGDREGLPLLRQPAAPVFGLPFAGGTAHLAGRVGEVVRADGVKFAAHEVHAALQLVGTQRRAGGGEDEVVGLVLLDDLPPDETVDETVTGALQILTLADVAGLRLV